MVFKEPVVIEVCIFRQQQKWRIFIRPFEKMGHIMETRAAGGRYPEHLSAQ